MMGSTLYRCKPEEIILHGEISGLVTDAQTNQPLQSVAVKLNPVNDTTRTGSDGEYIFENLTPGNYEIQVSSQSYAESTKTAAVTSAKTEKVNFTLNGIPVPKISDNYLDFGLDSVKKSFTISNIGKGKMVYTITASKDWITVSSSTGNVTNETDTITVTINKGGLSENKHKEAINIYSIVGQDVKKDSVSVLLNGIMDSDLNYYDVVTIGTQTWMAENLNVGTRIGNVKPKNNGIIEKYCLYWQEDNCDIYGGLYQWDEMMQYHPADDGIIGTTQGVCPVGWHIPTNKEWLTLIYYLGGPDIAGGKLKETGTTHWYSPNTDATNESGFSALGGDYQVDLTDACSSGKRYGVWASSTSTVPYCLTYLSGAVTNELPCINYSSSIAGSSVRCVKDPPKNK
jgi:uncharacterized protein (TIGR02145 family)